MKSLCIKTNNKNALEYLLNEFKNTDLNNFCFSENEFKYYKNIIIHYTGDDIEKFYKKISYILSFFVIDEVENTILNKLISQNYFYFDSDEKKIIVNVCYDIISDDFTNIFDKKLNSLYTSFYNYIINNRSIVLDGFINFRIKNYLSILDEIVCDAVNNYIIEKEYTEFISVLKYYINSHQYKSKIVHIIYSKKDSVLLDENKHVIKIEDDIFNTKYLSDITFSSNDYILNTLLTLLPNKIYIHLIDNFSNEFINTLKLIFEKRVFICTNCAICKLYKKEALI